MTARKEALIELRDKVKAGDDGFSSFLPIEHEKTWSLFYKAFDGSLDAAKALHEAVLREWDWNVTVDQAMVSNSTGMDEFAHVTGNPARAWLLAVLSALIALEENQ